MAARTTPLAELVLTACEKRDLTLKLIAHDASIPFDEFISKLFDTPDEFTIRQLIRIAAVLEVDPGVLHAKAIA